MKFLFLILLIGILVSCDSQKDLSPLDESAEKLVKLTLMAGTYDEDLVDSYIGDIKIDSADEFDLDYLRIEFKKLYDKIEKIEIQNDSLLIRKKYQLGIIKAVQIRLKILNNEPVTFLEECRDIYQYEPEILPYSHFDSILVELADFLGSQADLPTIYAEYRAKFKIANSRIDESFQKSVKKSASVTKKYIDMPDNESIHIEYVQGAPWSAYNWYKGNYNSLIQLNLHSDIHIERILDLAAHESYPGHHVYYSLREKMYYRDLGYKEFSIYTLFSPVSFLAEGTAVYGNDLVFPENEKIEFIRKEISYKGQYSDIELRNYFKILKLMSKLDESQVTIAKQFIDKEIDENTALTLLAKYGLESQSGSMRRLEFIKRYRSYIINYTSGKKLVEQYINKMAGDDHNKKWEVYKEILEQPYLPPDLVKQL